MAISLDPELLFFLGLMLAFVFGSYLFVRKILRSFREGLDEGRR